MKIAIINMYDSGNNFSIYFDGIIVDRDTIDGYYDNKTRVIKRKYKSLARRIYYDYWNGTEDLKSLLSEYDKIFYCDNGDIEVIK